MKKNQAISVHRRRGRRAAYVRADLHEGLRQKAFDNGTTIEFQLDKSLEVGMKSRRIPIVGTISSDAVAQEPQS
jgi:hypothetical protein